MNISEMSIAYSPESEVLDDVLRSAVVELLVGNAADLIRLIIEEYPNLPDIPGITWPNITLPPDITWPNITLPPEITWPNITLPPDITWPNVTLPPDITWPNVTLPPDFNPPDLESLNTSIIYEIVKSIIQLQPYNSSAALRGIYALEETTRKVIAAVEFDDSLYGINRIIL